MTANKDIFVIDDLVSVIIPCYQQGRFLADAVASLQAQTHSNWEAIIVNDGSTDETESIAQILCDTDARIHYISKTNGGLSSARNAGLIHARGNWIQFLDADDILLPDKFLHQINLLRLIESSAVSYTNYFHGDTNDPTKRVSVLRLSNEFKMERPLLDMAARWEHDFSIPIHSALFPAWLFSVAGLVFDESLPNHEDWDVWIQVLSRIDVVNYIQDEMAIYRVNPDSLSRDRVLMWRGFRAAIIKQMCNFKLNSEVYRALTYLLAMNDYIHCRGWRGMLRRISNLRALKLCAKLCGRFVWELGRPSLNG